MKKILILILFVFAVCNSANAGGTISNGDDDVGESTSGGLISGSPQKSNSGGGKPVAKKPFQRLGIKLYSPGSNWQSCFENSLWDLLYTDDRLWTCVCKDISGADAKLYCDFASAKGKEFQNDIFSAYNAIANPLDAMAVEYNDEEKFSKYKEYVRAALIATDKYGNHKYTCTNNDLAATALEKPFTDCQSYLPTPPEPMPKGDSGTHTGGTVDQSAPAQPIRGTFDREPIMLYVPEEKPSTVAGGAQITSTDPKAAAEPSAQFGSFFEGGGCSLVTNAGGAVDLVTIFFLLLPILRFRLPHPTLRARGPLVALSPPNGGRGVG